MANQPKKYKKFVATAATATLVASAIVPVASADTIKFSDVKDDSEFAPFIYDLAEQGVMSGAAGKFNPTGQVTRNAAVKTLGKWLVNVHEYEIPEDYKTKQRFDDIPVTYKDEELLKYAALVKDLGVFSGAAGKLNPTGTLTREQMAKVVVEAYSVVENRKVVDLVKDFESSLTDIDKVAKDLVDYVKVFEKYEVTTVKTFNPKGKIQRQHFAKFLSLAIGSEDLASDTAELPEIDGPGTEPEPIDYAAIEKEIMDAVLAIRSVEVTTANVAEVKVQLDAITAKVTEAEAIVAAAKDLTDAEKATFQAKLDLAKQILAGVKAKVDELLPGSVAEEIAAVTAAVAELPATVTEASADAAQVKVDAVKTATAALEKAIAEAKNLPAEAKAAAEKAVADAKAAAAKTQAEIDKVTNKIVVDAATAVNNTTVEVTFNKDTAVTAADLKDSTLTLVSGDKTLTATYLADSFGNGKAVYLLSGTDKLEDATTYEVTGSFTSSNLSISTVFGTGVAKEFSFITTSLSETTAPTSTIEIAAKDQYGKDYAFDATTGTIKVDLKINGVPQVADTAKLAKDVITINKVLKQNDVVEVTITNTINAETKYTATKTYTVGAKVTLAPTTISNVKLTNVTNSQSQSIVNGDEIKLSVDVRDQNNNAIDATGAVTWVVEKGGVSEATTVVGDETQTYNVSKAGELQISAYLANGQKVTYSTVVSATAISSLAVDVTTNSNTLTNNEAKSFEVKVNPSTSSVTPEELSYEVVSAPTGVNKADVVVTFAYGKDANKDKVFANVTAPKNGEGNYVIKFSAAGKSTDVTFVANKNTDVTQITVDSIATNELQVGNEVVKSIKFFNKHGEEVTVTSSTDIATVKTTGLDTVKFYGANTDGTATSSLAKGIKYVGLTAKAPGSQSATLVKHTGTVTIAATAVAAGKVQTLTLGAAAASVIVDDTYAPDSKTDNLVVEDDKTYTLVPVSAVDNYGVAKKLKKADFKLPVKTGVEYEFFKSLEATAGSEDEVKYIGIHVTNAIGTAKTVELEATLNTGVATTTYTAPKKALTVREARALKSISVTPTSGSVVVGAKATFTVTGVDQYDVKQVLDTNKLVATTSGTATGVDITTEATAKVVVKGKAAGDYPLTFTYKVNPSDATKDIKTTATFKVSEVEDAVNSITINKALKLGNTDVNADNVIQLSTANAADITFTSSAKDANGGAVEVDQDKDVIYSVTAIDVKDAKGDKVEVTGKFEKNVLTLSKSSTIFTGTVKVTATSVNGKTNTITLNVSNAPAKVQAGTIYFTSTPTGTTTKDGVTIVLPALGTVAITPEDVTSAQKERIVYLVGKDQYNNIIEVEGFNVAASNSRIKAETATTNGIKLTAQAAGSTTINVFANGVIIATVSATATQADVDASTPQ